MIKERYELYELASKIERISAKALSNEIEHTTALKNINNLCKLMRKQEFESSLSMHALAAALKIGKSQMYKKLRFAKIFNSRNQPEKDYESWFIKEHLVYYSSNGHRCSYDKFLFKKQFFSNLCEKI